MRQPIIDSDGIPLLRNSKMAVNAFTKASRSVKWGYKKPAGRMPDFHSTRYLVKSYTKQQLALIKHRTSLAALSRALDSMEAKQTDCLCVDCGQPTNKSKQAKRCDSCKQEQQRDYVRTNNNTRLSKKDQKVMAHFNITVTDEGNLLVFDPVTNNLIVELDDQVASLSEKDQEAFFKIIALKTIANRLGVLEDV